jgi:hypothetical protein
MDYAYLESAAKKSTNELFKAIQQMSLEEVGYLLLNPPPQYPALKQALPTMPMDAIQLAWTGNSGESLLKQSLSFVKVASEFYEKVTQNKLQDAKILDYGCGWGRMLRLMYKFTLPDNLYGCDAWEHSLQLCLDSGIRANLKICDEVPKKTPFNNIKFDFIYAFSVLTHLSEKTGLAVISALRGAISDHGIFAVTIRPLEYWKQHADLKQSPVDVTKMENDHRTRGFAFTPHPRTPINGDITYGDTSISTEYIADHWKGWKIIGEEVSPVDPYQKIVFLQPI